MVMVSERSGVGVGAPRSEASQSGCRGPRRSIMIHPRIDIGHVHLKVSDLERAIAFYSGVLGFELMQRMGDSAAFLSAGGYHHHIGLNTWESQGGKPPSPGNDGPLSLRHPLSGPRLSGRRAAAPATGQCGAPGRERSWRQRGAVSHRP